MSTPIVLHQIHNIHSSYTKSRSLLEGSMARLATGDRFVDPYRESRSGLAQSERLRYQIKTGEKSTESLQHASTFLGQADAYTKTVVDIVHRMTELAARSLDATLKDEDRTPLDVEYQGLLKEVKKMTKTASFHHKQSIGRDVIASFDSDEENMHFWNANGSDQYKVTKTFDNNALDSNSNYIGFDSSMDYTMSRDGNYLYFLGNDQGATNIYLKRYDIKNDIVQVSSETYASQDKLFADEQGQVFVNNAANLYQIDLNDLSQSASNITDMQDGQEYSVWKDKVVYHNTANEIVEYDLNTSSSTTLVANPSAVVSPPPANAANNFAAAVDHDISASGRYIADEIDTNVIRVIDTKTSTGSTISIGSGDNISNIQFNEDGDRLYYINTDINEIQYLHVNTDDSDNVQLSVGSTAVAGKRDITLTSLDLGGANYASKINFVLAEDGPQELSYQAADLRLYQLGLLDSSIDTASDAQTAIRDLQTAMNQINVERARIGSSASRFEHVLNTHLEYISSSQEALSTIRDVDIAKETSFFSKMQMQNTAASSMVVRFNELIENVLLLISR